MAIKEGSELDDDNQLAAAKGVVLAADDASRLKQDKDQSAFAIKNKVTVLLSTQLDNEIPHPSYFEDERKEQAEAGDFEISDFNS